MEIYAALVLPFTVWMLVDALRRRAALHWFFIVLFFAPLGGVLYLIAVKLRHDGVRWLYSRVTEGGSVPIEVLEDKVRRSPTFDHRLQLATALERADRHHEALPTLRALHAEAPQSLEVRLELARSIAGTGDHAGALPHFQAVVEADRSFDNFEAALEYAETLYAAGERRDAVDLLRALAEHTGRFNHRVALAHYLGLYGDRRGAQRALQALLADYETLTPAEKAKKARWRDRALELTEALDDKPTEH